MRKENTWGTLAFYANVMVPRFPIETQVKTQTKKPFISTEGWPRNEVNRSGEIYLRLRIKPQADFSTALHSARNDSFHFGVNSL